MPITTHRRFGVELEGFIDDADYGSKRVSGNEWDIDSDGSLRTNRSMDGIEAKSGPLTDTSYIHSFYEWLHENNWYVNRHAGLHIHVEVEDYTFADWQKLLALMLGIEPYIYSVTSQGRMDNSYCRRLTNKPGNIGLVLRIDPSGFSSHEYAKFQDGIRYYGLNFEAYRNYRKTVEFRYFAAQDEAKHVEAYVELVTKIVEFAKHATLEQVLVISLKLLSAEFKEARDMIHEVLQLECGENLVVHNDGLSWDEYDKEMMLDVLRGACNTHNVDIAV